MIYDISNLYMETVLLEMQQDIVDAISDSELPFDDIFGDDLRKIIPIGGVDTYVDILDTLASNVKDYSGFDPKTKEVVRKIKLDPKYGHGSEKEQRINLGKALEALKIDPALKKRYLSWYAKYQNDIPQLDDMSEYSMVLSRAPVDVVRMSDHRNIESCHSQIGSYFKCAIQEAKTGGAIAYLVKTDDLQYIDPEEFKSGEIFMDNQRAIQGIRPVSRLRVRRLNGGPGMPEFALPEVRVYGPDVAGFRETLNQFLKQAQPEFTPEYVKQLRDDNMLSLRGGSYTDNNAIDLLKNYFELDAYDSSLGSQRDIDHYYDDEVDESELNSSENRLQDMEDELADIEGRVSRILEFSNIGYSADLDDDNEPFYSASARTSFTLDKGIVDESKEDELTHTKTIEIIQQLIEQNISAFNDVELVAVDISVDFDKSVEIRISYDMSPSYSSETRDFQLFANEVKSIDDDNSIITSQIINLLGSHGYLKEDNAYSRSINGEDEWDYFDFDGDGTYTSIKFPIASYQELPKLLPKNSHRIDNDISAIISSLLRMHYKPSKKVEDTQGKFEQFFEMVNIMTPNKKKIGIDFYPSVEGNTYTGQIDITTHMDDNESREVMDWLDQNFVHIKNIIQFYFFNLFDGKSVEFKLPQEKQYTKVYWPIIKNANIAM